ncbi:MAG: carotenoid 1,2-hydratase, partial [Deltaproteobacteria bacterium]|nr:carotenoid 1,2-hydratase [Deltaproteobacteria bacterium]
LLCTVFFWILSAHVAAEGDPIGVDGFRLATGAHSLTFPRDHGAHPDYRTEWWYFTGHLQTAEQRTFGFELTFFRVGVSPTVPSRSSWATSSVYLAHFALTDDQGKQFFVGERASRGAFGEASAAESGLNVQVSDWSASLNGDTLTLHAADAFGEVQLSLRPTKPVVLHGERGLSQKDANSGDASYYSSFTRLEGAGTLRIGTNAHMVTQASAWMDHEFSSSTLNRETLGWDWFALQLKNGDELMLYQLRRPDGSASPFSAGTYVHRDGTVRTLKASNFHIEPLAHWTSERTKIRYPSRWRLTVEGVGGFTVVPTVADQELDTKQTTGVTYWEGRCSVLADGDSTPLGEAYVELVGYQKEE